MNYVLFFPDELRAKTLSCYGHPTIQTPSFDRLSLEGVTFESCYVQNPVCSPSRCCLFTGAYVHTLGHRTLWNLLKPHEHNMLETFKQAGYQVRVYGKNDLFSAEAAAASTDVFENRTAARAGQAENTAGYGQKGYYDFVYRPMAGPAEDTGDWANVQAGIDFIRSWKAGDPPYVLFLPLLFPHCPYTAPEPYYSMYGEADVVPLLPHGQGKADYMGLIRRYRQLNDPSALRQAQALYMGMVSFTDMLLGRVMDALDEAGQREETVLIASSDHGDYAGDYGLVEKWPSGMEDVLTHVPLLIRAPGGSAGHRVKEPVEMFDIMATCLDHAGLTAPYTHFARSLMPQVMGAPGDPERAVFCEGGYDPREPHCSEGTLRPSTRHLLEPEFIYYPKCIQQQEHPESVCRSVMMRTGRYKLVRRSLAPNEFYDLREDPDELVNRYNDPKLQAQIRAMESRMLDWYLATSDIVPTEENSRGL